MKLDEHATAVLTIRPEMGKDKLMQAAGRQRKLDRGQRIVFAVPPELGSEIRAANRINKRSSWGRCTS